LIVDFSNAALLDRSYAPRRSRSTRPRPVSLRDCVVAA